VAVLASVFSRQGNTLTGQGFVDGLVRPPCGSGRRPAAGALLALAVPATRARSHQREGGSDAGARAGIRSQRIVRTAGALAAPATAGTRARTAN
jgi:hypothetical protein